MARKSAPATRMKRAASIYRAEQLKYVARQAQIKVIDALNRVCEQIDDKHDGFIIAAAHRVFERAEW